MNTHSYTKTMAKISKTKNMMGRDLKTALPMISNASSAINSITYGYENMPLYSSPNKSDFTVNNQQGVHLFVHLGMKRSYVEDYNA